MRTERREWANRAGLLPALLCAAAACLALTLAPAYAQEGAGEPPEKEVSLKITGRDPLTAVRKRIYPTVAQVPAFPSKDRRFFQPSRWPETITIAGVKLQRKIYAWDEYIGSNLRSLREVRTGMRMVLSYVRPGSEENAGWGPRFTWDERRRLIERIWYEPDEKRLITHDYTYYRNGRLLGYSWRSGPRHADDVDSTEYLSEFFDQSGKLIAVGYEKKKGDDVVTAYMWKGQPVHFDEFRMKSHVLYAGAP